MATGFGQIDSSALRAKYGAPLRQETFIARPGVEMTATYSEISNQVCKLEIPAGVATEKEEDTILKEILPSPLRPDPLKLVQFMGRAGRSSSDYGNFIVSHATVDGKMEIRPAVSVAFRSPACQSARR